MDVKNNVVPIFATMRDERRFLSTKEVAALAELTPDHMYRLRRRPGAGPKWHKHGGKVRYLLEDVERWLEQTVHV